MNVMVGVPVSHDFRVTFAVRTSAGKDLGPEQIGKLVTYFVKSARVVAIRIEREKVFFELLVPDDVKIHSLAEYAHTLRRMVADFVETENLPPDTFES